MHKNCIEMENASRQILKNGIFVFVNDRKKRFHHDFLALTIVFRDFGRKVKLLYNSVDALFCCHF